MICQPAKGASALFVEFDSCVEEVRFKDFTYGWSPTCEPLRYSRLGTARFEPRNDRWILKRVEFQGRVWQFDHDRYAVK
jgi:hypothetical protein